MKAKTWMMVCIALLAGCYTLSAQEKKTTEKKRPTAEQMEQMQCNRIIKALVLDDATAEKFSAVYKEYKEDLRAARKVNRPEKANKKEKADAGQPDKADRPKHQVKAPKPLPTDAEVEAAMKARFAQERSVLDVREKYYDKFRQFLSPKQIQKVYSLEKKQTGKQMRPQAPRRHSAKPHHIS